MEDDALNGGQFENHIYLKLMSSLVLIKPGKKLVIGKLSVMLKKAYNVSVMLRIYTLFTFSRNTLLEPCKNIPVN